MRLAMMMLHPSAFKLTMLMEHAVDLSALRV